VEVEPDGRDATVVAPHYAVEVDERLSVTRQLLVAWASNFPDPSLTSTVA
jgi:hypothetical protein